MYGHYVKGNNHAALTPTHVWHKPSANPMIDVAFVITNVDVLIRVGE